MPRRVDHFIKSLILINLINCLAQCNQLKNIFKLSAFLDFLCKTIGDNNDGMHLRSNFGSVYGVKLFYYLGCILKILKIGFGTII